jgi:hypothetical protein
MLALLMPFLGIVGGLLPSIVRIFELKQERSYEIELTKIRLDAAERAASLQYNIEMVKADAVERQSLLDHDKSIDGGKFINALRASVRPVITYTFFFVFLAVKVSAAYVMINTGQSVPQMLQAVWDPDTMALFSTIIAFWFGSRVMEKQMTAAMPSTIVRPQIAVTATPSTSTKTEPPKKPVGTGRDK